MAKTLSKLQELRAKSPFAAKPERKGRGRRQINAAFVRSGRSWKAHELKRMAEREESNAPEPSPE